jgi:hypothetical protein
VKKDVGNRRERCSIVQQLRSGKQAGNVASAKNVCGKTIFSRKSK